MIFKRHIHRDVNPESVERIEPVALPKAFQHSIPDVPNDAAERLGALVRSTDELHEIQAQGRHVNAVASSVRGHLEQNHFIERLRASYGGNQ